MEPIFNLIGAWFTAFGIPPVLGAFVLGAAFTYFVLPRRARHDAPVNPVGIDRGNAQGDAATARTVEYDGREIDIPAEVMAQINSGNKIAAIKMLRQAAPLQLVDAKRIVDGLAAQH